MRVSFFFAFLCGWLVFWFLTRDQRHGHTSPNRSGEDSGEE